MLLVTFPGLFEVHTWSHVPAYTPDLGSLIAMISGVWLVTSAVRVVKGALAVRTLAIRQGGQDYPRGYGGVARPGQHWRAEGTKLRTYA
jgi:hypothetical protein